MNNLIHPSQISWHIAWSDLFPLFQNLHAAISSQDTLQKMIFSGKDVVICQNLQRVWQQFLEEYADDNGCVIETDLVPTVQKVMAQSSYGNKLSVACPLNQDVYELIIYRQDLPSSLQTVDAAVLMVARNACFWVQLQAESTTPIGVVDSAMGLGLGGVPSWLGEGSEHSNGVRWQVTVVFDYPMISQIFHDPLWCKHAPSLFHAGAQPDQWQLTADRVWQRFLQLTFPLTMIAGVDPTLPTRSQVDFSLFQSVLQQMPVGMFRADLDGSILEANVAFCQLIGYSNEQLMRLDLRTITVVEDFANELEMIQQIVAYGEQRIYEKRYRCANGHEVWAEVKLSFVGDPEDDHCFLLGFVTDLSDRRQIEAERQQAIQEIYKRQEREVLLNTIATQIRSALDLPTMLQTAVQLLNQALDSDRVIIYQLLEGGAGCCVSEAVQAPFSPMQGHTFGAECIPPPYLDAYRTGRLWSVDDVSTAGLAECHQTMLAKVQVQSMVATGILSTDEFLEADQRQLWGLLVVHHCRDTRQWSDDALSLVEAVANQLTIALRQTKLLNQLTGYTQELEERVQQRTYSLERSLNFEQLIRNLAECLYREFSPEVLFQTVVEGLIKTLNFDLCWVSIWDEEIQQFVIQFEALNHGMIPVPIACLHQSFNWQDLSPPLQITLHHHQSHHENGTLSNLSRIQSLDAWIIDLFSQSSLAHLNPQAIEVAEVLCPIRSADETVGLLVAMQFYPREWNPVELDLIEQTANYCAIALRQAHLYRQEHEQRLSAEYLRSFLEQSNDVYVEYDAQRRYTSINPIGCELLGLPRHIIIGRTNQDLLPDRQTGLDELIQQAFDTAVKVYVVHELQLPSGNRVFESVYAPITDPSGMVQRVIGVCRDVTDLKNQWQLLEQQNQQLAETTRIKQEFIATTSHELRTPLTAILGFSNVLLQEFLGELNSKQKDYIERIHSSGQHLLELINDILDLSRLEAGRLELDLQAIYIGDICESVMSLVQEQATKQGLSLDIEIGAGVEWVVVDPRRLKQMLLNLLTNAIKFTPSGQVGLKIYCDDHVPLSSLPNLALYRSLMRQPNLNCATQFIHFVVWDTGIGIAEADQRSLFVPFSQIDSSLARKHQGSGLGLVITQKLAELHGGWVSLQSQAGNGSRFTISLPLRLAR